MDTPTIELMSALASMHESGKYSDLTIVTANKSYPVHRVLLASRSSFFEGACSNPFRESETGVIDLTEDDPTAVEYMVHYFYHLDYLNKPLSRRSSKRSNPSISPRMSRFPARQPSKKLNLTLVEDPLLAMLSAATPATPLTEEAEHLQPDDQDALELPAKLPDTPMQDQFMDDPFDYVFTETKADDEQSHLVTHAKVYAIAEKYGIIGLKSIARKKFAAQIEAHLDSDELPEACQEAYESTVDTDRGLRDIIIQAFRSHPNLSSRKDVELVLRETPSLAFELFRVASGLPITS
ncbi:hypothetical protein BU23DRAFT_191678 [Bimuria novae-zelandiae CBS 107.79]|uniref:BTB domain-containing protein n=1 Tax=Bimuria novae-zelandiae CBS 107.79 TaxID=1447943 RepID=A0A6A5VNQ4_9PLEO|nr:hypothetical protein BU23DRAFT_191678 [Bimuria novae-zelandiae CBS 107.79]